MFVTHLQGISGSAEDRQQQAKLSQLRTLADEIRERNREKPEQPKLLLGDFNVHSAGRGLSDDSGVERGEYFSDFMYQMHDVGMQEAWLTYGGPGPDNSDCPITDDEWTCDSFEPHEQGYYQGNRLDHAFVEVPRPEHRLHLDVSRVEMFSARHPEYGKLSDHPGIRFDMLTSPAG